MDEQQDPSARGPGAAGAVEELGQGEDREPSPAAGWLRARWSTLSPSVRSLVVAVVGVAVGAAAVLGFQNVHGDRPHPAPSSVRPSFPVSAVLLAQDICTSFEGPILQVSFRIKNAGQAPVTMVGVRPDLPMGMLLTLNTLLTPSDCVGGPPGPADGLLNPGASQPVTFRLLPLDRCPQAAPVAAVVDLAGTEVPTVSVPVLVDLGSVQFADCATPTPAAP